ncbi:DUF975 family protein [Christensenellaceae bacterium OttesenSCG-928-K19]|nr:DUF975 family protein [Christensenellaceae bacterium OttesenSCG-928-K19]
MKSRVEIKRQAWQNVKQNYWPTIGVYILVLLIGLLANVPIAGAFIALFIITIITVGNNGYFVNRYRGQQATLSMVFWPFNRYGRVLGGTLWMSLWLFLWALIFIIPFAVIAAIVSINAWLGSGVYMAGAVAIICSYALLIPLIIKSFSYFCTLYILADCPDVPATRALDLSKRMMHGNKGKVFVAGLSFIGWAAIAVAIIVAFNIPNMVMGYSTVQFNLFSNVYSYAGYAGSEFILGQVMSFVGIIVMYAYLALFLGPYISTTMAGLYVEIKDDALRRGAVTPQDFGPAYPPQNYYNQNTYAQQPPQYGQPQQQNPPHGQPPQYGVPQQQNGQQAPLGGQNPQQYNNSPQQYGAQPQNQQQGDQPTDTQKGNDPQGGQE